MGSPHSFCAYSASGSIHRSAEAHLFQSCKAAICTGMCGSVTPLKFGLADNLERLPWVICIIVMIPQPSCQKRYGASADKLQVGTPTNSTPNGMPTSQQDTLGCGHDPHHLSASAGREPTGGNNKKVKMERACSEHDHAVLLQVRRSANEVYHWQMRTGVPGLV